MSHPVFMGAVCVNVREVGAGESSVRHDSYLAESWLLRWDSKHHENVVSNKCTAADDAIDVGNHAYADKQSAKGAQTSKARRSGEGVLLEKIINGIQDLQAGLCAVVQHEA